MKLAHKKTDSFKVFVYFLGKVLLGVLFSGVLALKVARDGYLWAGVLIILAHSLVLAVLPAVYLGCFCQFLQDRWPLFCQRPFGCPFGRVYPLNCVQGKL